VGKDTVHIPLTKLIGPTEDFVDGLLCRRIYNADVKIGNGTTNDNNLVADFGQSKNTLTDFLVPSTYM
jgi:hypothetical protein